MNPPRVFPVEHSFKGWKSKTLRAWQDMHRRCYNKNCEHYHNYGGRGISVCERWHIFDNFLADMGIAPEKLSLDRKNNDSNYEPSNCRWTTQSEQLLNTRLSIIIKNKPLKEIAKECKLSYSTLYGRLFQLGWSLNEATEGKFK